MMLPYRLRQGLWALFAFARPIDDALVATYLSPPLLTLFCQMRHSEQLHALNVLRAVLRQADDTPDELAVAALLHDVGKSRYPLPIWQKTVAVAIHTVAPSLFYRLAAGDPDRLSARPFAVKAHHPAWSAAMLARTGVNQRTLWLVAHHQDHPDRWRDHPDAPLLARLQRADDTN